jgi:drug/metabolite transporter (DMT)-like permease
MEVSMVITRLWNRIRGIDMRVFVAFFAIYVLWGSTFLAIRIAVLSAPPWFCAGTRFFLAGVLLYGFTRLRGGPRPNLLEWRNLFLLALLLFVVTYGALFWAEMSVPSGMTSILEATIPLMTIALEVFVFRRSRLQLKHVIAVVLGFGGVVVLVAHSGTGGVAVLPMIAILGGSLSWSLGSVLTGSMRLPQSKGIAAGAEMMIGGAILLALSAASDELHPFPHPLPHLVPKALLAVAYLVVAGSLIGFSAFVWLLGRMPATRVSSHAYVNPVVALALGHFIAGEAITPRMLIGGLLVVVSVVLLLAKPETNQVQTAAVPPPTETKLFENSGWT